MFADDPEGQPISIIITTLAAEAYKGELDLVSALQRILADMEGYVQKASPRVPNPVNPNEDFADKWGDPKYRSLALEEKFWLWLQKVKLDFNLLQNSTDINLIAEQAKIKFATQLIPEALKTRLESTSKQCSTEPKSHKIVHTPARPWAK